jgi:translation initiation factor IF-2
MSGIIQIDNMITVGDFADLLHIPATKIIAELFKSGLLVTINEKIDFETAQIIVSELKLDLDLEIKQSSTSNKVEIMSSQRKNTRSSTSKSRPPVVAVMGHVDHGKTSLLDAIRTTKVVDKEAGGITQHIRAYQIEFEGRKITFLDTPGHEAFASIREHGAYLTDLVVLVIAADDGMKPQTLEAIRFAKKAGVRILVAITKIDKEGSDPNKIKQQLSENDLMPEEWGGDVIIVEVSAKSGEGISRLLEMILLVTDVDDLQAEEGSKAKGLVIESRMEPGRGATAVCLVEEGILRAGQVVLAGDTYGKIKIMETTDGETIKVGYPSSPVVITGLKSLPNFADTFEVVADEKTAKKIISSLDPKDRNTGYTNYSDNEILRIIDTSNKISELNIVIKADTQGSLSSVIDSLKSLNNEEVGIKIVSSGIGNINENDIRLAASTDAIIMGFHVALPSGSQQLSSREKVRVDLYTIIYELIDTAKIELTKLLKPEIIEHEKARLLVRGIFRQTKTELICGGEVTKGKLSMPAAFRMFREKEQIGLGHLTLIKQGQVEAKEIGVGEMCGVSLELDTKTSVAIDDRIEFFEITTKERTL